MNSIVKLIDNSCVYDIIDKTPLTYAELLSAKLGNNIYIKREDKTAVHSFKIRGAYQKIASLTNAEKKQGIITATAGNHAQGVALSAQKLAIVATIVMPKTTPKIKVASVIKLGAKVILFGVMYDDALQYAKELSKKENLVFIHAYDDKQVIAGQGTIALELLEQLENIDYIFVPVGGGGLITGIASYITSKKPSIKVIAVEPNESPALTESLLRKSQVVLDDVGLFADGVAVKKIGDENFRLIKDLVKEAILTSNDEICAAIKDIYDDTRVIAEPSGALALSGAKKYIIKYNLKDKNIVVILSGANINFDRLRHIAERAELGENKEAIFAVTIAEQAGSFLQFCKTLDGKVITEFNYRYGQHDKAHIFVGIATEGGIDEKNKLLITLGNNYSVVDMSDNEMAKTHIRYMVGGKTHLDNEVLYRFIFPEKPGALIKFLISIGNKWNISLFHYRNHGADFGRVLVGFQAKDISKLENNLNKLGYKYFNETNNIAYAYFL